jgi:membrane associated rhomboid family serine protease
VNRLPFYQRPLKFTYYNATLILIFVNIGVFVLTSYIMPTLFNYLAMTPALVIVRNWWFQVFTYMFVHGGFGHIFFNILGLFIFGVQLERRIGSNEFLLFYLLSGVVAGLLSLLVYWLTGSFMVSLVGASGALFAVMLAFATYFPTATILLFGLVPIRAPILVVGYAAIELVSMFVRNRGGVAHLTHLAGFLIAFVYLVVRLRINPIREFRDSRRY